MKTMKIRHPKLVAAIAAITAPPAIVAFAWAIAYVPIFRLVMFLPLLYLLGWLSYRMAIWFITHWDGFKEMVKDMWK